MGSEQQGLLLNLSSMDTAFMLTWRTEINVDKTPIHRKLGFVWFCFFETGFLCVALAVLELTL